MIRNYNTPINNACSYYSNLSVKEGEDTWAGYGDGSLINDSSLGKAKVPSLSLTENEKVLQTNNIAYILIIYDPNYFDFSNLVLQIPSRRCR
jgi:hypothetical protein